MSHVKEIPGRPTVVLVHGAFADSSSWKGVIECLQATGVHVTAPANPLRGLSSGGVGHKPPQEAPRAFADAVVQVGPFLTGNPSIE